MTRGSRQHAAHISVIRRNRSWLATAVAGLAAGALLLSACGGDDDDSSGDSSTTTNPVTSPTQAPITQAPITQAPVTQPVVPTTPTYVTEGASVMVTNASRVDGAAGRMSERLGAVGFTMVAPGNYTLGTIDLTIIYFDQVNPAAQAVAESVKVALGGGEIQVVAMPTPPPVDTGDVLGAGVLVAMGNDTADKTLDELQGIVTTTTAPADTSSSDSSADTASSSST